LEFLTGRAAAPTGFVPAAPPALRVLLVEDNPADADLVREALAEARAGTTLVCVERISEALERAGEGKWDVVLLDLSLPDAHELSGLDRLLRAFPDLAIVVLTSLEDDRVAIRAVAEGAQDYLLKSQVQPSLLVRSIRYAIERQQHAARARALADARAARLAAETSQRTPLLRSCRTDPLRVLLVEDNPADADLVREALAQGPAGATLVCVERISEALERAREGEWDVVLLDLSLPDAQELSGAHRLRLAFPQLPIIVLTSLEDDRVAAGAVAEGAQDYLLKAQIAPSLLVRSIRYAIERQHYAERARLLAEERAGRIAAETAQRRALLLSELSGALFGSIDDEATIATVARVLVRELADWCVIELGDGASGQVLTASAHVDQTKEAQLRRLRERTSAAAVPSPCAAMVMRTGSSELHAAVPEASLAGWARDADELELLREVGLRSAMVVPVAVRGRIFGAMTLAAVGFRRYGPEDVALADEIARRLAMALDNSRMHRETQRAVRVREDVLAVVSHDLKSPLQTISLAAHTSVRAVDQCAAECKLRRPLETIQRAARSANVLLRDLLDMASIRAGRLAIRTATEDAAALITEALQAHEELAREKGISLASEGAVAAAVLCDRDRVQQVFSNVIVNAVTVCRPGDRIDLTAHADERFVTFTVADSGPGIAADALPFVFEAYWSSAKQRSHGTGLGLFICKGIVEAQGGRMWIESRVGEGTKVRFTIPAASPSLLP
jgi:signal transduction histidine kinase/CheY-like chemotaxis protein